MGNIIGGVQVQEVDFASDSLPHEMNFNMSQGGKIADVVTVIIDNDALTGGNASTDIGLSAYMSERDTDAVANAEAALVANLAGGSPVATQSIASTASFAADKIVRKIVTHSTNPEPNVSTTPNLRLVISLTAGNVYTAGKIRVKVLASSR